MPRHSHEEQTHADAFEKTAPSHPGYNSTNLVSLPGHQGSSCSIRQLEAVGRVSHLLCDLLPSSVNGECDSVRFIGLLGRGFLYSAVDWLALNSGFFQLSLSSAAITGMSQNAQASIKILFIYIYVSLSHSVPLTGLELAV